MLKTPKKDKSFAALKEEHLLSLFVTLFTHTSDIHYLRLVRKFMESECEKVDRIMELFIKYNTQVKQK